MNNKNIFNLTDFQGPLDLLLYLIRKSEINIYDIPISEITDQYLIILDNSANHNLEDLSEFYLMATTLLYIKSRMLLPVEIDVEEEAEDPRTDLVAKLIDYQKYKKISELMKDRFYTRELTEDTIRPKRQILYNDDIWEEVELSDLFTSYKSIRKLNDREKIVNLTEEVTINEKITLIDELLSTKEEFYFDELIKDKHSLMEFVCSFLAILDSIKYRVILVYQNVQYGTILLKKGEGEQ
ncbi:MAG: segregation/condensation protein A [Spirochaetaceae bacterium]